MIKNIAICEFTKMARYKSNLHTRITLEILQYTESHIWSRRDYQEGSLHAYKLENIVNHGN